MPLARRDWGSFFAECGSESVRSTGLQFSLCLTAIKTSDVRSLEAQGVGFSET
jgi:hypothetical protein